MGDESDQGSESKYRPKFLSEYSMGQLDFIRYNDWLKYVEEYSAIINSTTEPTLEMIQHLFSGLVNLYDNWRPIIALKPVVDKLDDMIEDAKTKKRIWESNKQSGMPTSLKLKREIVDILGKMKRKLMDVKQVIGLGIVVRRNISTKQKIRAGVKGFMGTLDHLPES